MHAIFHSLISAVYKHFAKSLHQSSYEPTKAAASACHCRFLKVIPNETINVYTKGKNKPEEVKKPLASSIDLVEVNIKVWNCTYVCTYVLCNVQCSRAVAHREPLLVVINIYLLFLQCLAVLAQEIETKEQLALLVVQSLLFALDVSKRILFVPHICCMCSCTACFTSPFTDLPGRGKHQPSWPQTDVQPLLQVSLSRCDILLLNCVAAATVY